jgi:hypothetical protein
METRCIELQFNRGMMHNGSERSLSVQCMITQATVLVRYDRVREAEALQL